MLVPDGTGRGSRCRRDLIAGASIARADDGQVWTGTAGAANDDRISASRATSSATRHRGNSAAASAPNRNVTGSRAPAPWRARSVSHGVRRPRPRELQRLHRDGADFRPGPAPAWPRGARRSHRARGLQRLLARTASSRTRASPAPRRRGPPRSDGRGGPGRTIRRVARPRAPGDAGALRSADKPVGPPASGNSWPRCAHVSWPPRDSRWRGRTAPGGRQLPGRVSEEGYVAMRLRKYRMAESKPGA